MGSGILLVFSLPLVMRPHLNCGMKGVVALDHSLLLGRLWIHLGEQRHVIAFISIQLLRSNARFGANTGAAY
jgi:hypothetical protein